MGLQGWIIYNGHLPGNKFLDFAEFFHHAAKERNVQTMILKNTELLTFLSTNTLDIARSTQIEQLPDFVIFTDKDIYLAKQLELMGVRVYNRANTIEICDDKIATYQALATQQLPIPKTIVAPKVFPIPGVEIDMDFLNKVMEQLTFPIVIKEAFGSFGEQVYLVKNQADLVQKVKELAGKPFVFQEFISTSYGEDIRLQVVGNKVAASMLRRSENDFRANVSSGGVAEKYYPTKQEEEIAIAAAKAINADFAGVDLLFGPNQQPIICEINSNAHIRNLYECTNINVAYDVIDYIINQHA